MTTTYSIRKILDVSTRKGDGVTTYLRAIVTIDGADGTVSLRAEDIAAFERESVTVTDAYLMRRAEAAERQAAARAADDAVGETARASLLADYERDARARGLPEAYLADVQALIRTRSPAECEAWCGGMVDPKTRRAVLTLRTRHGVR